jgi:hypothetical protein
MTTDNICFYLRNGLIQSSQTEGQRHSDTSPFSIAWSMRPQQSKLERLSLSTFFHRVRLGCFFLSWSKSSYLKNVLTPSSQRVGSQKVGYLWIPPGWWSWLGDWSEHSSNGFDKLKSLTNSHITLFVRQAWCIKDPTRKVIHLYWLIHFPMH